MKRIARYAVGVGLLIGLGLFLAFYEHKTTVIAPKIERIEVEKEVEVPTLEKRISDAQNAAQAEIKASAQEAYDAAYDHAMREIELEVTRGYRAEIEARETQLEKEVGVY